MLALFAIQVLLPSCNTTQYLDQENGEKYLVKNTIEFEGKPKGRSNLTFELVQLSKQQPNRKFFGVPRPFFYYAAKDTIDKSGLGKAFARTIGKNLGEEPVLADSALARQSSQAMTSYLQNKGYFFAEVSDTTHSNRKRTKAKVIFHVDLGGQFVVDTISYLSQDTAIQRMLNEVANEGFFQKGSPLDIGLYEQEVSRITRYLRNNGYAYFYPQYISNLEAPDTSNDNRTAVLELEVLNPAGKNAHPAYTVGNIYMNPSFDPASFSVPFPDTLIDGIFFSTGNQVFKVKPRTLTGSVSFRTGEGFDQSKVDLTIRQLGSLGVFRPPTVRFEEDTIHAGVLNFFILLTPNKKWEFGADFDVSNTTGNSIGLNSNLIGVTVSPSLRNRNFLGGAELLVANTDFGAELDLLSGSPRLNSLDFRLQNDLYFPRFVDYFGLWKGLNNLGATRDGFYQTLRKQSKSRFSSSYNLQKIISNYTLHFVNLSYGFDFSLNASNSLSLNHFGIDLLVPNIVAGSRFAQLLDTNKRIKNSYSRQFITGFLFRDLTYTYVGGNVENNSYWFFRGYFDISGLEAMGVNSLYNSITGKSTAFMIRKAEFSHYAKVELEGRHYWNFGLSRSFIARANGGVTQPYYHSEEVPYVKQFFVGGPSSLRGWYARGLGPGLYTDDIAGDPSQRNLLYQSGDLKFEFNFEYRFFLMKPLGLFNLHGAVFLDGGNIWTLGKDADRPGSEFSLTRKVEDGKIVADNFLRETALGTGFGTRWDFTFFIFRLDLGTPLRNNFPDPERNNTYWRDLSKWRFKDIVPNIGLGYPF